MRLNLVPPFNDVAIQRELADQRIHLAQRKRRRAFPFEVAANEMVLEYLDFDRHGTGVVGRGRAKLFCAGKNALNAAHRFLPFLLVHGPAQKANPIAGVAGTS